MKVLIITLLILFVSPIYAADNTAASTLTLNLDSADVLTTLNKIAEQTHISILADSSVKGKVSCNLSGVTLDQTLNTICTMNKWEWMKVQVSSDTEEKLTASKLFALLDSLKELEKLSLICDDPKSQSRTAFIPSAKTDTDTSALTSSLKLKTYYLIRAIPDPAAAVAETAKTQEVTDGVNQSIPPADPRLAATQVWDYFGNMSNDQRNEVFRELREKFINSMTPEQREAMFSHMRRDGGNREQNWRQDGHNNNQPAPN